MLQDVSDSDISWIGSVQASLMLLIGVASGPLFDAGFFRTLLATGGFLLVFGMFMTSICTEYWQVMLAQGVAVGLGGGCLATPSIAIVSTYFSTRKSIAIGMVAAGSGVGGVVYPIAFAQLQPRIGFGWATRVIAFIILVTMLVSAAVMRVRLLPAKRRRLLDPRAFLEIPFTMIVIGFFFGAMGVYIPFFYIGSYSTDKTTMSDNLAFYMLVVMNTGSVFGRLIPNFVADRTGPLNVMLPFSLFTTVVAFSWVAVNNTAGIIVFAIFYGFLSGTYVSLPGATIVSLSPDLHVIGARIGMCFFVGGLGLLVGTPVAGAILQSYGWLGTQLFCGACLAASTVAILGCRLSRSLELTEKLWGHIKV
ncbi:hypothetical protein FE257_007406 [Aspergillus nanangensis]|uniref:Major facilitator superfamily (MFS) profile domain-containing protein n=1 Tax=Aspergillus nanangensis TaxID=2582783 RepID=A0AAD4CN12_ASPNN|nr:hypothetical protein FE257_007406 [Aspergillus nanangensis]